MPPDTLTVLGDRDELIRALENLIENALKYGAAGKRVDVTVGTRAGLPEARVAVRDYGPGIPEEQRPLLFRRFVRLPQTGDVPGSGIGLYIAKSLVEAMHGRIWHDTPNETGSTFRFTLPVEASAA